MSVAWTARPVGECRICGKNDWQEVVSFGSVPLANSYLEPAASYADEPRYPLDVVSCRGCRLMTLTRIVDPEVLYRHYVYISSQSDVILRHMRWIAETCQARFEMPADSLVVEIGSNTGEQLAAFTDLGMRALGVDPARNLAAVAGARGHETIAEFFTPDTARHIRTGYGAARLILGRHVFAHIDDLATVVAGVRELLEPAGVFAVEVPYLIDLMEGNQFDTVYHEHLSYFAVGPLAALFERHGLRIVDVERVGVHGGSIVVFAARADSDAPVRPSVARFFAREEAFGLYDEATYGRFAHRVIRTRDALTTLVRGLVADGKRVAGYGAPAKGNTLLSVCGLGPGDVEFCSDTTDLKQGRVLPGTHIPVWSPAQARRNPPDYYLLLAWNYADEIVAKEEAFVRAGGRFIVPIPEPRILPSA